MNASETIVIDSGEIERGSGDVERVIVVKDASAPSGKDHSLIFMHRQFKATEFTSRRRNDHDNFDDVKYSYDKIMKAQYGR